MSLLDDFMEEYTLIEKRRIPDGEGGYTTEWTDGMTFMAAVTLDNSMQARIAEKDGVTAVYTVTTKKAMALDFHDVIRRESDGKTYRITSADKRTPKSAGLDMAQMSAEEWTLT